MHDKGILQQFYHEFNSKLNFCFHKLDLLIPMSDLLEKAERMKFQI